jgi:hypothetical protein
MKQSAYRIALILVAAALLAAGCEDSNEGTDDVSDSDTADAEDLLDGEADAPDGDDSEDAVTAQDEIGKPCSDDDDCLSEFCVRFEGQDEGFCSIRCFDNDECETDTNSGEEFSCESLPITAGNLQFACVGDDFCYDPDGDDYGFGDGCPRIGFDCDQSDSSINPGANEQCDAIDHNCNGFIADAVVFPPETRNCIVDTNIGVCRAGQQVCRAITNDDGVEVDTEVDCIANIEPGSQVERCNGLDDDCDGIPDELDEDIRGVGQACSTGATECVDGTVVCDPDEGILFCEGSGDGSGGDGEPDVCDGIDNDCDGTTDENFKNDDGIYDTLEHCGACNVNCVEQLPGDPDDINVEASCNVSGGVATCGFSCRPGFVDADGFDENGCEFSPDTDAIYVARPDDGGDDGGNCGAFDDPCATIERGLNQAQSLSRTRVRVASGAYPQAVDMRSGISVLGGHDPRTWNRDTDIFVSSISGGLQLNRDLAAVVAENITNPTELSGFNIVPAPVDGDLNSVGILVRNSNDNLTIRDNQVFASRGGDGAQGAAGSSGQSGSSGQPGAATIFSSDGTRNAGATCLSNDNEGGAGGQNNCGGEDVSGGSGGTAGPCANFETARGAAPGGSGPDGGAGGANGTDSIKREDSLICGSPDNLVNAADGENGASGSDGSGGSGASNGEGAIGVSWNGIPGSPGGSGTNGSGGGGGGHAPNVEFEDSNNELYLGASGGGGGAGGCAGTAGQGGSAGGASFAIFISGGTAPVVEDNLLARGPGGNGGNGGNGGAGGSPGEGGPGGVRDTTGGPSLICVEPARPGGDGGRGGNGGGGGGAGGVSFDIGVHNVSGSPSYESSNEFNIDGNVDTGGVGGQGGSSPSNEGDDGVDGDFGNVIIF